MIKKFSILVLMLVAVFSLTACDTIGNTQNGTGELALNIADKPVNDVEKVLVTIEEVQVISEEDEVKIINDFEDEENGEKEFDLMTLRFDKELLGQETLEAGLYNQIRLIVAADDENSDPTTAGKSKVVYKVEADKDDESIFIPSGAQTGLKIDHNFEVREDSITELTLDIEISKVMHEAGNSGKIILKPTAINVIDEITTGSILGRVVDTGDEYNFENDVVVEVYNNDDSIAETEPIKSTVASAEELKVDEEVYEAGSFLIRGLEAGTYKLKAYTAAEDGSQLENALTGTAEDIEVNAEKITELEAKITLK